jgi:hypothetical protein
MASTTFTHETKEAFLREGIELTILEHSSHEEEDCAICTRPIYNGTSSTSEPGLRIIACGHVLGHTCALKWLETANSCPFCRAKLFPAEPKPAVVVVQDDWAVQAARDLTRVLEDPAARAAEEFYEAEFVAVPQVYRRVEWAEEARVEEESGFW